MKEKTASFWSGQNHRESKFQKVAVLMGTSMHWSAFMGCYM